MFDWIKDHQAILWTLGSASVAIFIASIFIIPAIIVRIRPDYFAHDERPASAWIIRSSILRVAFGVGKNLLGVVLMITGVAMLVTPGPGLQTLLIGFLIVDFPGKYRFERWLFARPIIRRPINWLRIRAGRMPLITR